MFVRIGKWDIIVPMNTFIKDSPPAPKAGGRPSLDDLRGMMREKFPEAHVAQDTHRVLQKGNVYRTGVPCLDEVGIVEGTVTEIACGAGLSSGGGVLLAGMIMRAREQRRLVALIDGVDSFDPQGLGADACDLLLWLRCRHLEEAMKVADLLLRDGNVRLVLCDLVLNPLRDLKKQAAGVWYRLKNLAEESGAAFVVFTPEPLVSCAHLRLVLDKTLTLAALDQTMDEIETGLRLRVEKGGRAVEGQRSTRAS